MTICVLKRILHKKKVIFFQLQKSPFLPTACCCCSYFCFYLFFPQSYILLKVVNRQYLKHVDYFKTTKKYYKVLTSSCSTTNMNIISKASSHSFWKKTFARRNDVFSRKGNLFKIYRCQVADDFRVFYFRKYYLKPFAGSLNRRLSSFCFIIDSIGDKSVL